jgi:hypothetical protein
MDSTNNKIKMLSGALAGVIGGMIMAGIAMVDSSVKGLGFFLPTKLIAATFLGIDAISGGVGTIALGIGVHVVVAAALGLLYSFLIVSNTPAISAFLGGLFYGTGIWFLATYMVLPAVNPVFSDAITANQAPWFIEHLVFGGLMLLVPILNRAMQPQRQIIEIVESNEIKKSA